MKKYCFFILFVTLVFFRQCGAVKEIIQKEESELEGMDGLIHYCTNSDSIESILISKAEAILSFDDERYEVNLTLYSKRDSIIYISAVNSGFELLRATIKQDSIKVINRINKIVYSSPVKRKFGYQLPVDFYDLQNLISNYYLCDDLEKARDTGVEKVVFDMDEPGIKKRISLSRIGGELKVFEFYHQKTDKYLMGERQENVHITWILK
jgi:uncharacterized protein DUF4292